MLSRILPLLAVLALCVVISPARAGGTEPQVIIVDPSGASVASAWDKQVNVGGRPVDIKRSGATVWWLDDLGRERGGVRFKGGKFEVLERSGTPLAEVKPTAFGWSGKDFEVRRVGDGFEGRREGHRVCLARPRSAGVVDLADATGKVQCSARGLTPDRMALWWMVRGTPEEACWLVLLAPAKKP